jgi:YD repeat-containing protein
MSHLSTSAYLRGTIFVGNDGSNLRFQADEPIADMVCSSTGVCPDTYEFMPSGYLYFPDGTIYRIVAGNVTWIRDVEGNRITYAYNDGQVIQITDSLGRQVNISYGQPTGNPHEYYDAISFQGEGGEWRQVKVYRTTLEYALRSGFHLMTMPEMFPEMLLSPGSSYDPIGVVSRVELPDERSYRLFYTPYNEIARVELPTGAAIEYDYPMPTENGAPPQGGTVFRPLRERRVYAQSNTQNAPFEVKQVYVRGSDGNNSVVSVETQVRQVAGGTVTTQAKEAHSFYGEPNHSIRGFYTPWSLGREYKTEVFTPDGNTLLRRSETEWENPRTVPWNGGGVVANGARVKSVTTTVAEADPDLVAKVEYQ